MICYKDRTYCPFFSSCSDAANCSRALTDEIKEAVYKWWGNQEAPICVYVDKPECYYKCTGYHTPT